MFIHYTNITIHSITHSFTILLILICTLIHPQIHAKITIDNDIGEFIDSRGFVKLFHGINCVRKVSPFYYPIHLNATSFKVLRDWGVNVIRLAISWFALKPFENETNWEYVDIIERIVDNAELYGIYIIIDLHQDGLSKRLGAIDSVPYWFMDKIKRAPHYLQYPWPLTRDPSVNEWFLTYATYESAHVFESIYRNVSGIWSYFAEYWVIMTERFGSKRNLLGYNLLNEPAPGNVYKNPFVLLPCKL
ncbi:hypothetical protein MN116_001021 [Schistosoma mekongi]|uniref:Glycoside hydrolase family 5 domain-containing protein n=1 Tax=Schistosoma mekongi TaxID=38744 RepID=A0AAE1ZK60_SCHME|nr:hypothetical protein MN116_001021 [Schistosoma mekongi]